MKRYFNRTIEVENKEVTRTVVEDKGVATVNYKGSKVAVKAQGNGDRPETKWTVK